MEIRGIIHCHSTYSYDGKLTLPELKAFCVKKGIQFVCMTEHTDEMTVESARAFVDECHRLSDETFCFVPGFEVPYRVNVENREGALGFPSNKNVGHAHVLMIGATEFMGTYAKDVEALHVWTTRSRFVVLAHPVRNDFFVDDGLLKEMHALEVWNQQYEGKHVPRTHSLKLLAILRKHKQEIFGIGGVDFHRREHMGAPYIHMQVDACTESQILEKLCAGAFIVRGERLHFYGTLLNSNELIKKTRCMSMCSVCVIQLGKMVNATLARFHISLPRSLKERIRRYV